MSDDDLFSRWSRRKRLVEKAEEAGDAPASDEADLSISGSMEAEEEEAEVLERLGLPLPESLKMGDDFSAFMAPGVPGFLKTRALKVLWGSNPVLANLDGLNDYDDDFRSPELTKKVLATGYKVGRGFIRDIVEGAEDDGAEEIVTQADADAAEPPEELNEDESLGEAAVQQASFEDETEEEGFRPRRMRFET